MNPRSVTIIIVVVGPDVFRTVQLDDLVVNGARVQKGTDARTTAPYSCGLKAAFVSRKPGLNMWQRSCPVCQKLLEKKHPAETVQCPCGKYVWKG
jgi:hypothetical protein